MQNIREIQSIELEILEKVDEICKKYKIEYFLDSGTALGAVRHAGFIPWDDDIDIGMTRDNYEKFIQIAQKELGDKYFLHNFNTEKDCPCLYSKVKKNNTLYMSWASRNLNINQGIYIDIFPYDTFKNIEIRRLKKLYFLERLFKYRSLPDRDKLPEDKISWKIGSMIYKIIHRMLLLLPKQKLQKVIEKNLKQDIEGEFLVRGICGKPVVLRKEWIFPLKYKKFEGKEYPIPRNEKRYLEELYGDYMELPPLEKRSGHCIYKIKY